MPRRYISTTPSSDRNGAPLFALRIFGCSVSAISNRVRCLVLRLHVFQCLNPEQAVFVFAEGVRAALGDYRLRFQICFVKPDVLVRRAMADDGEAACAHNLRSGPALSCSALVSVLCCCCHHLFPCHVPGLVLEKPGQPAPCVCIWCASCLSLLLVF